MMTNRDQPLRVSVIGLGNVFLGDDGFGPLAVEVFRCQYECPSSVEVLDLGTPGLDLAPYMYDRDLILILDAVNADLPSGKLSIFREDDFVSSRAKLRITGHDPGLWESLAHLRLAGHAPSELIIVGIAPESCVFGDNVNPAVMSIASEASDTIATLLTERGIACYRRPTAEVANLWWMSLGQHERTTSL